jgi:hypothetical protein
MASVLFKGKFFLLAGKLQKTHEEMKQIIRDNGGEMVENLGDKKVDLLRPNNYTYIYSKCIKDFARNHKHGICERESRA